MSIIKNEEYIVKIIDNGFEGEGIAKIDDFTIFIRDAIKGEKVRIVVVKVNKNFAYGKILEILEESTDRKESDCIEYKRCGGCNLRHLKYEATLNLKKNVVENCLVKALKVRVEVKDTIGMENPLYYRNKLQYPIGVDAEKKAIMGVFANRTHQIIPISKCFIQDEIAQNIANDIYKFILENNLKPYNEKTFEGNFRHIVIKVGKRSNEIMVILVCNHIKFSNEKAFVENITKKYPQITTIVKNINNKNTNVILGEQNLVIFGDGYIKDNLGDYKFKISPMSFYQVNPVQAEVVYNKAIELAKLKNTDVVYDLYCGIGTISIFISKYVKKVYGIEVVEDAIKDAEENIKINDISNVEFLSGEVENILPELMKKEAANIVIVDPPRKGLETSIVQNLLEINSEKIIYISCNPATLARDISLLSEKYKIEEVQPIDMFPYTTHVESVVVLGRK